MASFGQRNIQAAAVEVSASEVAPRVSALGRGKSPLADPIEERLWDYYDNLEEISFPVNAMANLAQLVSYYPAMLPSAGDELDDPQPATDSRVLRAWDAIGGEHQIAAWVADLVFHYWIPGQAWLAATRIVNGRLKLVGEGEQDADDVKWEVLSTDDLMKAGNFDKMSEVSVSDARFWRLYTPSRRKRSRPDSPVRRVRKDCELLMLYQADLMSSSKGRQNAGVKAMPARLKDERLSNGKSFADQIAEDMNAWRNPESAAGHMPLLAWLEPEDAEVLITPPVKFADPDATNDLLEKQHRATQRVAMGLDLPTEMMLGTGDVNHWSLWLIDRNNYEHHLDPLIVRILNDLTPWFRARLAAAGIEAGRIVLWRNPDSAVANPNDWEQSVYLYENLLVSDEWMLQKADVGKTSQPDDQERLRRLLERIITSNPGLISNLPGLSDVVGVDLAPQSIPESTNPAVSDDMPVVQAATQTELDRLASALARIDQTLLVEVEQAVAREAGRLQRVVKSRIAAKARAEGRTDVDEDSIAEELGVLAVLAMLGLSEIEDLVNLSDVRTDRIEQAIKTAQTETDKALTRAGASTPATREQDRTSAVALVTAAVAAAVAGSVFKRPRPQGEGGTEIVPMADVRGALDVAGGGAASRTADGEEAWELVANGRHTVTSLDQAGIKTDAFQWVYGTSPRSTFEPHLRLDGEVFPRWDDEKLSQEGSGEEWVGGTHWYPADHRGCRCSYRRVLVDRAGVVSLAASG